MIRTAQRVVDDLFGPPSSREFVVRYWDGTTEAPPGEPSFTLEITSASALRRMLLPPSELSIVEAYLLGGIEVQGDIEAAANLGDIAASRLGSIRGAMRLARHVLALPARDPPSTVNGGNGAHAARRMFRFGRAHSSRRDAHAVRFHYDVGNDFYALWLDRRMVYSCAYFASGDEDLDTAQVKKLDHVCRKLRLKSGERFLDIGCGWGALVLHAARHYGVRATGITLSAQQASFARARIAQEQLTDRVTIQVRDYRELGDDERYDKIASVGMVEHVGLEQLPAYFAAAHRALTPGGLFLNHGIVSLADARPQRWLDPIRRWVWQRDQFIRRYVFPDGDLVPTSAVIARAEHEGFELRDVESLREHYRMTLRHWVRRLEQRRGDAQAIAGEFIYRVWRLYMSAAAYGFRIGRIGVIQSLFAKPHASGRVALPLNRADLYSPESARELPPLAASRSGSSACGLRALSSPPTRRRSDVRTPLFDE